MIKRLFLAALLLCVSSALFSAVPLEKIWGVSVNPDNTVTFRFRAPNAGYVVVRGTMGKYWLQKGDDGVWTATTPQPVEDGFHEYTYLVDDVLCTDPTNYFSVQSSGIVYSVFIVPGEKGDLYSVQDVPHGTVSQVWYHSDMLGMDRMLNIYTPAGYECSRRHYPVLYLLHGSSQFDNAWIQSGRMVQIMDNLIAQGKAEPMIVVMPNGNRELQASPGLDTLNLAYQARTIQYLTKTNNGEWETAFPEIVRYMDRHFRTIAKKKGRAITGLSMGGSMSLRIAADNPAMFDYVGCFSCYVDEVPGIYEKIEYQLTKKTPKLYCHICGPYDVLYPAVRKFWDRLEAMGLEFEHEAKGAEHDWYTWRICLTDFAQKIFKD